MYNNYALKLHNRQFVTILSLNKTTGAIEQILSEGFANTSLCNALIIYAYSYRRFFMKSFGNYYTKTYSKFSVYKAVEFNSYVVTS